MARVLRRLRGALLNMRHGVLAALWVIHTQAFGLPVVSDYDAVPPLLAESAKPMVMLAVSKDHQLFIKPLPISTI